MVLCAGAVGGICQGISTIAFAKSGEALTMRMRVMSFASMLRQEIGWFDREENRVGALVTQLSSDTSSLKVNNKRFEEETEAFSLLGFIRCPIRYNIYCGWCNYMYNRNRFFC